MGRTVSNSGEHLVSKNDSLSIAFACMNFSSEASPESFACNDAFSSMRREKPCPTFICRKQLTQNIRQHPQTLSIVKSRLFRIQNSTDSQVEIVRSGSS